MFSISVLQSRERSHSSSRNRESRVHQQQQQPLSPQQVLAASAPAGTLQMQVNPNQMPTLVVALPPPPTSHMDPPPPYTGPRPTAPPLLAGPSHGYGEGRGHYNRNGQTNVPTSAKPMGAGLPQPTANSNRNSKQNVRSSDLEMKNRRS